MREEIYLLHYPDNNPKNWGVFFEGCGPDPYGFPKYLYHTYGVNKKNSKKLFDALLEVRDRLVELNVLPTPKNAETIYPTIEELSKWDANIRQTVFERIRGIIVSK